VALALVEPEARGDHADDAEHRPQDQAVPDRHQPRQPRRQAHQRRGDEQKQPPAPIKEHGPAPGQPGADPPPLPTAPPPRRARGLGRAVRANSASGSGSAAPSLVAMPRSRASSRRRRPLTNTATRSTRLLVVRNADQVSPLSAMASPLPSLKIEIHDLAYPQ